MLLLFLAGALASATRSAAAAGGLAGAAGLLPTTSPPLPPLEPPPQPVPNPRRPAPFFSWDTIPLAFHGANRSGLYNETTVQTLAKYQLVTIEKWYTACGGLHPIQAGPECDVEKAMYHTFNQLKAISPNHTNIMYLNSMFDFSMYRLHGQALELEASGTRVLLRDRHDELVLLCNDGNYYCNVTNFDWSKQAARELWTEHVRNATRVGGVDGVFADHAGSKLHHNSEVPGGWPALCNGKGTWNGTSGRRCWEFTPEFAAVFNAGHGWIVNHTQDMLAPLGGPVIDGPYGKYNTEVCDFPAMAAAVARGQSGAGPFVLEASKGGCTPDASCIAAYLLAATEYTYLGCLHDEPQLPYYPDLSRPLGPPEGPAVQAEDGVWSRRFGHGAMARWYPNASVGTMQWPGEPKPPEPAPLPPPPADPEHCGTILKDHTFSQDDVGHATTASAGECCKLCARQNRKKTTGPGQECAQWAWHGSSDHSCHLHSSASALHAQKGTTAAYMPKGEGGIIAPRAQPQPQPPMPPFGTPWFSSFAAKTNLTVVPADPTSGAGSAAHLRWTKPEHFSAIFGYLPAPVSISKEGSKVNISMRWRSSGDNVCKPECFAKDNYCQSKECRETKCQSKSVSCLAGTGDFRIALLDTSSATGNVSNSSWCAAGVEYKEMTKCVEGNPFEKMRGYDFRIFPHLTKKAKHEPGQVPCSIYRKTSANLFGKSPRLGEWGCFGTPLGEWTTLSLFLERKKKKTASDHQPGQSSSGSEVEVGMTMNGVTYKATDHLSSKDTDSNLMQVDAVAIGYPNGRHYTYVDLAAL
jgi:hypothetical protein